MTPRRPDRETLVTVVSATMIGIGCAMCASGIAFGAIILGGGGTLSALFWMSEISQS